MKFTIAYDPVTRIEGHLKIELTIDKVAGNQQIVDAKASGGLFRGFEKLLIGHDPRDAQHITERICGVCPVAHGVASVRAQDDAFGTVIPANARIMRNLVNGSNFVESHILHFYLLAAPDFVEGPAMPPWQADWKTDRRFSKADNDALMGHYLQALTMRRKADQMTALFGGRAPHPPAYIPGGFTCTPRQERIDAFDAFLDELIPFIQNTYIPDVEFLAAKYDDYFSVGKGHGNLLSYGVFDLNADGTSRLLARGQVVDGSRTPVTLDAANITEHVAHSWFAGNSALNPSVGDSTPENPKNDAYSWLKAPRYADKPYEVGPLARMWVNGDYQNGVSVMDRHLARAYEALKVAQAIKSWVTELDPAGPVYTQPTPQTLVSGVGLTEAPRGALGHWLDVDGDGRLAHYQVISPTTWNCSPRDNKGVPGPLEEALLGTPIENPDEPVEAMRVVHSYDPCLDCATHVIKPGKKAKVFRM
ncbi:MAG: nickel-dependent hydrogenase large subunit [Sedimentisphaerales bacterium]|nr:nickel-dependent hydrogenase large subunit [Sedimentisphaerales bacterium]